MINDSAARHLSIDSLTPINESRRSLCFIKVATYEILKRARQQHNTALQRAGCDLLLKESEGGVGGTETGKAGGIALTRVRIRGILTSASQKLRQRKRGEQSIDTNCWKEMSEDGGKGDQS